MLTLRLDTIGRVETSTGDGWQSCRILVDHTGRAGIWQRGPEGHVWSGRVDVPGTVPWPTTSGAWTVQAVDGVTLTVTKEGCGCGSRLSAIGESDLLKLDIP